MSGPAPAALSVRTATLHLALIRSGRSPPRVLPPKLALDARFAAKPVCSLDPFAARPGTTGRRRRRSPTPDPRQPRPFLPRPLPLLSQARGHRRPPDLLGVPAVPGQPVDPLASGAQGALCQPD